MCLWESDLRLLLQKFQILLPGIKVQLLSVTDLVKVYGPRTQNSLVALNLSSLLIVLVQTLQV